ncbi:MAG: efflux RND transporter periplasmic adaptor subunit [Clostridiales bacterium]|nr:efflux RND transporter periplasmic adaptor subunit [Clostridiales bacterium]
MAELINETTELAETTETETAKTRKKPGKPVLIAIAAVVVIAVVGVYFYFNYQSSNFVKTNNASVQCDMVTMVSKMSGNILSVNVKQGDYVRTGDVLMQIDPSAADSSQIDNSNVRSTINGTVLKTLGAPGQMISAGQTIAYVSQDNDMYVTANIDEKVVNKLKLGQNVDITIDQFGSQKFYGKVTAIGSATLSAFSIVPSTSSGTFVKETQYTPVKIQFVQEYDGLLIGANATVSIHIK